MDDYYSLLGVDADATVDDIRGAYRERKDGLDTASDAGKADAAKLNKAWNVLSDPYQRGRYDEQRACGRGRGELGVDDDADGRRASNGRSRASKSSGAAPPQLAPGSASRRSATRAPRKLKAAAHDLAAAGHALARRTKQRMHRDGHRPARASSCS